MDEEKELAELQRKLKMLEDRAEVRKNREEKDEGESVGHVGSSSGGSVKRGWPEPGRPTFMREDEDEEPGSGTTPQAPDDDARRPSSSLLRQQVSEPPSQTHLSSYASLLGMDPESYSDSLLMWIAAEGLVAPLPPEWCWYETEEGDVYYIHIPTRQTQWEHPVDAHYENVFRQHQAMLQTVLLELSYLEQLGWGLALPMTSVHLTPGAFLDPETEIYLHKSWSVDDVVCCLIVGVLFTLTQAYPGERSNLHIEEVPIDFLKSLASCTVSPAQPGIIHLSTTAHDSGAVITRWLEATRHPDDDTLSLTFRENSEAPSGVQLEDPPTLALAAPAVG